MTQQIDLYFDFSSPYSYLSVARANHLLDGLPIRLNLKPIVLGSIFKRLGWESSPFLAQARKLDYMWLDVARQARRHGLPFHKPSHFPVNSVLAARVATCSQGEPWLADFCVAAFQAYFVRDEDLSEPNVIGRLLIELGLDSREVLDRATSAHNKSDLRLVTEQADALGVFGAPTFVVNQQLFWGDDRFEAAVDACIQDSAEPPPK
ncbi:2-hydroxychromene-2-carboxylate isomerase [Limnobacter sp.]|uniref:2-hydroxychromene-2-carboxylate isomerase n=1 Tax=Limnobacter sp. TaxID=2003368 RepID=UPI0025886D6A|nr:2-hydroxychromene-2-carboxylate isomerase [Limnobacter sp.]